MIAIASVLLAYFLYPHFLGDDTFIHIGFIKDLAAGKGFSFAGTKTYGSTSPLWVILGAGLTKLSLSPETAVRLLSLIFSVTAVYLLCAVLLKLKLDMKIIIAAVASLALNPFFLRWALSGMEVSASITLLLLIYILFNEKSSKKWYLGGLVFGLGMLIRPEFAGFFLITVVYYFIIFKERRKDLIVAASISFIIAGAWLLFAYSHFGTVVPNTYLYKAGGSLFAFKFDYAFRTGMLFLAGNLPEFVLIALLLFAAFFYGRKNGNISYSLRKRLSVLKEERLLLPVLWISVFYLFYILKDVTVISRYSLMLVPFVIIVSATLFNRLKENFNPEIRSLILFIYLFIIIFGYGLMTLKVVKPASDEFVNGFQTTYREMASIIKNDPGNSNKTVALTDVGIIGCYSGAKVYDFAGLVDHSRFNYNSTREYLIAKKPDYVILREDYQPQEILPEGIRTEILFQKKLGGFGINHSQPRVVTLYKLFWE